MLGAGGAAWDALSGNALKQRLSKIARLKMERRGSLELFMIPPFEHYAIE
jgi:hypothetical protein